MAINDMSGARRDRHTGTCDILVGDYIIQRHWPILLNPI